MSSHEESLEEFFSCHFLSSKETSSKREKRKEKRDKEKTHDRTYRCVENRDSTWNEKDRD